MRLGHKMKPILLILLIVASPISRASIVPGQVDQTGSNATRTRILTSLQRAKIAVTSNRDHLSKTKSSDGRIEGFKIEDVISGVNAGRDQLLRELTGPELSGLRLYVEKRYPSASPATLESRESDVGPLVSAQSEERAFKGALNFISTLRAKFGGFGAQDSDLSVNLTVTSEPDEAHIVLKADSEQRETRTNNPMPNVFRGLYEYTITKGGFKTGRGQINLIDDDGLLIQCKLVGPNDSNDSYCKQVRAR